ncbi:hypothetical protein SERLA73DRAFT_98755 [Serpula lacrymans var. lacrymans S7.3]|uniref:MIF4G domain-containing protein n=2 Tax=Serpula lacrymans var. lacrymans TaxID=341189 RepID=F8QFY4_SERL3|nr:hypothetical protein SERLA73DRAFT_98755 [Serpula lacrymans var. lacrymans S7.3]
MSDVEKEERLGQVVSHDTPKVGLPVLSAVSLEAVAPLRKSANRWVRSRKAQIDTDSSYIVDRKVRALLNKLTMTNFESITDQIIAWANKSGKEKDGRTLIQVIRLVFEKATNEAMWSEVYARLCKKMMEQISPKVQDDGIKDVEGNPIAGGQLFRRYLLNRCQEDFEHGWGVKKTTTLAAETIEKDEKRVSSDEFYVTQQARQRGLGLVKFIGELFKLHMLGERVMHECVKRLLVNVENPEEEDIESLCMLLSTVGEILDTPKARAHMDVYFTRMKNIDKSGNVSLRIQFTLQDIIQLRERKWVGRKPVAAPMTPTAIHETIPKRKLPRRSGFTTK